MMNIFIFDFEATTPDPTTARILQLAFGVYNEKGVEQTFHTALLYDETYAPIPADSQAIHGITDDQIKTWGKSPETELLHLVEQAARCDFVAGHNIRNYDLPLLMGELERYRVMVRFDNIIDTRFDIEYPSHITTRKLTHLCADLGIIRQGAHSARHDVDMTKDLLFSFPLETTLERAKSPNLYIRADVTFNDKEKAKERKYNWDTVNKIWVKQIKELDLAREKEASFPVLLLKDYKPK